MLLLQKSVSTALHIDVSMLCRGQHDADRKTRQLVTNASLWLTKTHKQKWRIDVTHKQISCKGRSTSRLSTFAIYTSPLIQQRAHVNSYGLQDGT